MTLELAEGLRDAFIAEMESSLPAQLDIVQARFSPVIDLDDITEWAITPLELESLKVPPIGFALVPTMTANEWRVDWMQSVVSLNAGVIVRDADKATLRKRLDRTLTAMIEVMLSSTPLGSGWMLSTSSPLQLDYLGEHAVGSQWLMDAVWEVSYTRLEQV